jgi:hypothetical protein
LGDETVESADRDVAGRAIKERASDDQPWTISGLVRFALEGKLYAIERYDSIIWKIRSGYVVVLYGAVALVGGRDVGLAETALQVRGRIVLVLLATGISSSALLVDLGFVRAKLRVVHHTNILYKLVLEAALDPAKHPLDRQTEELRKTIRISGETSDKPATQLWRPALLLVVPIYAVTPLLVIVLVLTL